MLDRNFVLKGDELFLVGEFSTEHSEERASGLYARDTRHLSRFRITINGQRPSEFSIQAESAEHVTIYGSNPILELGTGERLPAQRLLIEQSIGISDRLTAIFSIENFTERTLALSLGIEIAADFRDLFDIRGFARAGRGTSLMPIISDREVVLGYEALDGLTAETQITFDRDGELILAPPEPDSAVKSPIPPSVFATFPVEVGAGARWSLTATILVRPADGPPLEPPAEPDAGAPWIETDYPPLSAALERSLSDLDALQTSFPHGSVPAAGIPWFVAPFGRDSLIVGLQTLWLMPERAAETLRVLATLQGAKVDLDRDEEPGKILHEMRYGEMARLHEIPHTPYYGSIDATPLFVWLFAETVAWTGDQAFFDELLPNAERAIDWIEHYGDLDGDGLVEYRSDGPGGSRIVNQVWKDSHDSLNHIDGRELRGPIAAVEVQGYVHAAYSKLARVVRVFGDPTRATELEAKAESLRQLVEDKFWMDDADFYAQALDGRKERVRSLSSNPGHLLLAGVPSAKRAYRLLERMKQPDFDSGWGIRTLAQGSFLYNPMSYHNGSVWPHDNSLIAAGCFHYQHAADGNRIVSALIDAAATDRLNRLPELYCGFGRQDYPGESPVSYPVSCSPQAWAAGAIPLGLKAIVGLEIDLESRRLLVNPAFPEWLSSVAIANLPVLGTVGSLAVTRTSEGYEVQNNRLPIGD